VIAFLSAGPVALHIPGPLEEAIHALWANLEDPTDSGIDCLFVCQSKIIYGLDLRNHNVAELVGYERLKKERVRLRSVAVSANEIGSCANIPNNRRSGSSLPFSFDHWSCR
jgi:hypothetical protein